MKIEIELYPIQFDFVASEASYTAFVAGIGSGKTLAGCVKALAHVADGGLGLIAAPTYPMLRDATLRTFEAVAGEALTDFHKGEMRATVGKGEILFRSADDPDRLRGPNLSWAYLDEAALCREDVWRIILGRLREGGRAGPCWLTTTPKGRNWIWKEFVKERRPGYALFRASTKDNPYLSERFVENVTNAYTGQFAAQELEGEFVTFEGLVYDNFGPDNITEHADFDPARGPVEIAYDDGFAASPRVFLFIQRGEGGEIFVFDELYHIRHLPAECISEAFDIMRSHIDRVTGKPDSVPARFDIAVGDPSAVELAASMRRADIPSRGAKCEIVEGIKRVRALVRDGAGTCRLLVHPRCREFAREMGEDYRYPEGSAGRSDIKPVKENDHGPDAIRYWAWLRARAFA